MEQSNRQQGKEEFLEFLDYLQSLKKVVEHWEKNYARRKAKLFLANGQNIELEITKDDIVKLCRVPLPELASFSGVSITSLDDFLFNAYRIYSKIEHSGHSFSELIPKDYQKSVDRFLALKSFRIQDIAFVCQYCSMRDQTVKEVSALTDYYVAFRDDRVYTLLGLCLLRNKVEISDCIQVPSLQLEDYLRFQIFVPLFSTDIRTVKKGKQKIEHSEVKYQDAVLLENRRLASRLNGSVDVTYAYLEQQEELAEKEREIRYLKNKLKHYEEKKKREKNSLEQLKQIVFPNVKVKEQVFLKALKALSPMERQMLSYYYGILGVPKKKLAELVTIYEFKSAATIFHNLEKIYEEIRTAYQSLLSNDPFIDLLIDPQKFQEAVAHLPQEQRYLLYCRYHILDCGRFNYGKMAQDLAIPYAKVKKLEQKSLQQVRDRLDHNEQ